MRTIPFFLVSLSIITCIRCSSSTEKIVHPADYEVYLGRKCDQALKECNVEMDFWKHKLSEVPESETYRIKLAGMLASRFTLNGRIEDIEASDSLYQLIVSNTKQDYASLHRALAANCITQHQFREARAHIQKALEIGEGKAATLYMLVDVNIELGDLAGAKTAMKQFTNKNFFPYLIRQAKLKDQEGNLDSAIVLMERALDQVKENPSLFLWTQSNLADMYGHADRVKESYDGYLSALKQNPDYDYALKGIAWIAFSHDQNFQEAKRIVHHIEQKRATPDMHLFLAEIARAENDSSEKLKQLELFTNAAVAPKYGDMYNKYLALVEAEEFSNPVRTIEIARIEIRNRPTPQSFDLLAWGYFNNGNMADALAVAQKYIENKTYEPDALYHLAMIYQANGMEKEAMHYFKLASASSFELGPAISEKIKKRLNS